jgi:iron complex outermembrane receptor protein
MRPQEKIGVRSVRLALGVLAGSLFIAGQAMAQEQVQRVEITGSNIKRINSETASSVQVIGLEEIKKSGATTVKQLLEKITSSSGVAALNDNAAGNSFSAGASAVSLRNMGKNGTLVLVNGRRVSNYGLAEGAQDTFTNIDTIPAGIIERVEILKDGASAIYGSDAVAGVINFITSKEFKGVRLEADVQGALNNTPIGKAQSAGISYGFGDLAKDDYNIFAHVDFYHRNPYTSREIVPSVDSWYKQYVSPSYGDNSTYSYPGNYYSTSIKKPAASCPTPLVDGLCTFDNLALTGNSIESKRVNFYSAGRMNLSSSLSTFGEISYSNTNTSYLNAPAQLVPGRVSTWFDARGQKFKSFTDLAKLSKDNPYNTTGVDIPLRYSFADDTSIFKKETTANQYRVLGGFEGTFGAWDWNSAIGTMGSKVTVTQRGGKSAVNYLNALNSGAYKFGGQNSPELLLSMFPEYGSTGDTSQTFIDAKASRELMQLPGGALAMAMGVDIRHEKFTMRSSENLLNAEIVGSGSSDINGQRNLFAAFVELNAPITKKLEANFALRADKGSTSEASVVPKVGLRYEVNNSLMFRGTAAGGFRAPNLAESGTGRVSAFQNSVVDPKRCENAKVMRDILKSTGKTGDIADSTLAYNSGCVTSVGVLVTSNPDLKAEKSKSFSLGMVFEPVKNINFSIDYFNIERRDEIGTKDIDQVLGSEDSIAGSVVRQPLSGEDARLAARVQAIKAGAANAAFTSGAIAAVSLPYINLAKTRVSGIDMDLNSRWNWDSWGKFTAGLEATYNIDYRTWDSNDNDFSENLNGMYGNPRYKAVAKFSLTNGAWANGVRVNMRAGTSLMSDKYSTSYTPEGCAKSKYPTELCRVEADATADYSLSYSGFKNTTINLNIVNMFDRHSIIDVRGGALFRARTFKLGMDYRF